jgi:hypothetical protein
MKKEPGDIPAVVLFGMVEIIDCREKPDDYQWILDKPEHLNKQLRLIIIQVHSGSSHF